MLCPIPTALCTSACAASCSLPPVSYLCARLRGTPLSCTARIWSPPSALPPCCFGCPAPRKHMSRSCEKRHCTITCYTIYLSLRIHRCRGPTYFFFSPTVVSAHAPAFEMGCGKGARLPSVRATPLASSKTCLVCPRRRRRACAAARGRTCPSAARPAHPTSTSVVLQLVELSCDGSHG